jgi:hypothetical protein
MTLLYKTKCRVCDQFKFLKSSWGACLKCHEKRVGKYAGPDRKNYL